MLLGLDSYSYHLAFGCHPDFHPSKPMDLFEFMDNVVEHGLQGFQIDPLHLKAADDEYLQTIRAEAEARGLFIENGIMSVDPADIERGIRVSTALGSTVLRTFIGFNRYNRHTSVQTALAHARENILSVIRRLEQADVRLAIENHGDVTSSELVQLVEDIDSPNVGICLDVGNSLCVPEDPLEAATRMVPFAFTTHFKDYAIVGTHYGCKIVGVALGDGVLPMEELFRLLVEQGDLDRLILEIPLEAGHGEKQTLEKEEEAIRRSVQFCRERLFVGNP